MSPQGPSELKIGTHDLQVSTTDIADVLELSAGVFATLHSVKRERSTALKETASAVKRKVENLMLYETFGLVDTEREFKLAGIEFDKRTKRIARKEKMDSTTNRASGMKASVEKSVKTLDDKELDELQAKLKEVEQIIGKKRKVNEVNGDVGGN